MSEIGYLVTLFIEIIRFSEKLSTEVVLARLACENATVLGGYPCERRIVCIYFLVSASTNLKVGRRSVGKLRAKFPSLLERGGVENHRVSLLRDGRHRTRRTDIERQRYIHAFGCSRYIVRQVLLENKLGYAESAVCGAPIFQAQCRHGTCMQVAVVLDRVDDEVALCNRRFDGDICSGFERNSRSFLYDSKITVKAPGGIISQSQSFHELIGGNGLFQLG